MEDRREQLDVLKDGTTWLRHSSYEIAEQDGVTVIRPEVQVDPAGDIRAEYTRVFPMSEGQVHLDLLNIVQGQKEVIDAEDVLGFVGKWGLLGLHKVDRYRYPHKYDNRFPIKNIGYFKPLSGPETSLWYWFYPGNVGFVRFWQEPLPTIVGAVLDFANTVNLLESKDSDERYIGRMHLNQWTGECGPAVATDVTEDPAKLIWSFPSLLHAAYLRLMLDLTGGIDIRRCQRANCRRWFSPRNPRAIYCSTLCQDAEKQRRYRARQREKRRKRGES